QFGRDPFLGPSSLVDNFPALVVSPVLIVEYEQRIVGIARAAVGGGADVDRFLVIRDSGIGLLLFLVGVSPGAVGVAQAHGADPLPFRLVASGERAGPSAAECGESPRAPLPPPARMVSNPNVEPIQQHDLVSDLHEAFHEPGVSVAARVHLGNGTKLAVGAEDKVAS